MQTAEESRQPLAALSTQRSITSGHSAAGWLDVAQTRLVTHVIAVLLLQLCVCVCVCRGRRDCLYTEGTTAVETETVKHLRDSDWPP